MSKQKDTILINRPWIDEEERREVPRCHCMKILLPPHRWTEEKECVTLNPC